MVYFVGAVSKEVAGLGILEAHVGADVFVLGAVGRERGGLDDADAGGEDEAVGLVDVPCGGFVARV